MSLEKVKDFWENCDLNFAHNTLEGHLPGYEKLTDHTVVHIEDGLSKKDCAYLKGLGIHYIKIKPWASAFEQESQDDKELVKARKKIEEILK